MAAAFTQSPKFLPPFELGSRVIYLPLISHYFAGVEDGGGRELQEIEINIRTAILIS